jgi:high-affinity nickel permease
MSSLPALNPVFRPNVARLASIAGLVGTLVLLGFLVPFWVTAVVAAALVLLVSLVRAFRQASMKADTILREELGDCGE